MTVKKNRDFANMNGVIWVNGEFIEWPDAKIHILNHGLHYASCIFEGMRSYSGNVFKMKEHFERFTRSAKMLDFEIPYSVQELSNATNELLSLQGLSDSYIRPVAWLGSLGLQIKSCDNNVEVAIAMWQWPNYFTKEQQKIGLRLIEANYKRPDPRCAPSAAKASGMYMICSIEKNRASTMGYDDALMMDYKNDVAESTASNIFFIKKNEIHTPTTECILNGITRLTVIDISKKLGYPIIERDIKKEEIPDFDDVFLTGTAAEIVRVREIDMLDGQKLTFQTTDISTLLIDKYHNLVRHGEC